MSYESVPCVVPFCANTVWAGSPDEHRMCGAHSGAVMPSTAEALERAATEMHRQRHDAEVVDARPWQRLWGAAILEAILCQLSPGLHGNEWRARLRENTKRKQMMEAA